MLANTDNLENLKEQVRGYYNIDGRTGGMWSTHNADQIDLALTIARSVFNKLNQAVVFDIDETVLDKSQFGSDNDYGYTDNVKISGWTVPVPAMMGVKAMMAECMQNGVEVYLITSRTEDYTQQTINQLNNVGIVQGSHYTNLILKPKDNTDSTQVWKTAERKKLYDKGLTIIVNIGDKDVDLQGGYCEHRVLLNNTMY